MTDDRACPAELELLEFAEGRALPEATARIRQHLSTCPKCRTTVQAARQDHLGPAGTTRLVPVDNTSANPTDGDELTSTFDPNEEFDLSQLSASQEIGSLGRLGDYEILGILGRGGYGVVMRAQDNILGRTVAIKVLEEGFAGSAKSRRRFTREAKAAAQINHPNVVTIHAIDEHEGMPFIVMELVAGKSLRDWIRDIPHREFMDILR
ncbi:MAG TPA: protein kinase, partial [Planctomycetaceae bacterium]